MDKGFKVKENFEEKFPYFCKAFDELLKQEEMAGLDMWWLNLIENHCLDKEKVKRAIEKLTQHPPFKPKSRWIYKDYLLKELGLE